MLYSSVVCTSKRLLLVSESSLHPKESMSSDNSSLYLHSYHLFFDIVPPSDWAQLTVKLVEFIRYFTDKEVVATRSLCLSKSNSSILKFGIVFALLSKLGGICEYRVPQR